MKINSKQLLQALNLCGKAINTNNIVPAASCFKFTSSSTELTIQSCNMEVSMQTSLICDGEINVLIPADKIIKLLSSLPDQGITIDVDSEFNISIIATSGIYELSGYDGSDFPEIKTEPGNEITVQTDDLTSAIYSTSYARSIDPIQSRFIGLNLDIDKSGLTFAGCNLLLLSVYNLLGKFKTGKLLLPANITNIVGGINIPGLCTINYSDNSISFEYSGLTVKSLLSGETFPDYKSIVPKNDVRINIPRTELLASIKRVLEFSNKVSKQIYITSSSGTLTITGFDTSFKQKAVENIKISEMSEISISVNGAFLSDALAHLGYETIELSWSSPQTAIIINEPNEQNNFVMIMAMVNL